MVNLETYLKQNTYPGRGILIGQIGGEAVIAYFIMGRSVNSRNRIFKEETDGIRTCAFDESKMTDPSLIIYYPYRTVGNTQIVTNGDQTDTIWEHIKEGKTFADALRTRTFEPDAPNFTPRISGMTDGKSSTLSILKKDGEGTNRSFFEYPLADGVGRLIHTYDGDGNPIPSFTGEPREVALPESAEALATLLWDSLNADNKVSLFVRCGGKTRIINKHEGE